MYGVWVDPLRRVRDLEFGSDKCGVMRCGVRVGGGRGSLRFGEDVL